MGSSPHRRKKKSFHAESRTERDCVEDQTQHAATPERFSLMNNFPAGLLLPTNFTFAVTFQALLGPDEVGVALFNPVTVGQNYPDYWLNTPTGWELLTNSVVPVNFAARFDGTVPEPSVIGLSLLGGIAALATARRRRGRN